MSEFMGRTVLITGAAGGQGEAEARLFGELGAHVVVADLDVPKGEALVADLVAGEIAADFLSLDVARPDDWERVREHLESRAGRLDVLVNNAGTAHRHGLMATPVDRFTEVLAVNLTGPFLGMQTLAPLMRDSGGGSVVNIGSAAGMTGHFSAAYSSSKWGLRGLSKVAAMEFAPWNVRVNCVHPGIVNTNLVPGDSAFPAAMTKFTPVGRPAEPSDIAPVVVFLCSASAGFITGADLNVDGGLVDLGVYDAVAKEYAQTRP